MVRTLCAVCMIVFLLSTVLSQETMWTYYNTWCMGDAGQWTLTGANFICPTNTLFQNRGKITHIIVFPVNDIMKSDFSPYLSCSQEYVQSGGSSTDSINVLYNGIQNPGQGTLSYWKARGNIETLIDSCHKVGIKVLLCVNAVTPSVGWNYVVEDSTRTQMFARVLSRYVNTHNFDGADFNVEGNPTPTLAQTERFYRIVRQALGPKKLLTSVPLASSWSWYNTAIISYLDYILPQCYIYASNWQTMCRSNGNFLSVPLHKNPCPLLSNHQDITTWGPNQWYAAGWPKKKIVVLTTTNAFRFVGTDKMFSCLSSGYEFWADTLARAMLTRGGEEIFDTEHVGAYIRGTATSPLGGINTGDKFYIAHRTTRDIDSVVAWSRSNGYSNFGFYDVATDAVPSRKPVLRLHNYLSSILNIKAPQ